MTTMGGIIISRIIAAASTPFWPSAAVGEAMARWVMVWLVPQ